MSPRLCRTDCAELRHEQHGAVHAADPTTAGCASSFREDSGIRLATSANACVRCCRENRTWMAKLLTRTAWTRGRGPATRARRASSVSSRRHRQRGHELRLADAHRDRRRQPQHARRASTPTRILNEMKKIPCLRDVQFQRDAGLSHRRSRHRSREGRPVRRHSPASRQRVIVATSSSRFIALNYWQNPKTGLRLPGGSAGADPADDTRRTRWRRLPIARSTRSTNLMVRDVARVAKAHAGAVSIDSRRSVT